ncbi:MAG: hypothetical protein K0U84_22175 [Actinomycetia bacterium]|nr:hypothetical protein [Actinomycetes bacterium]
MSTTTNEHHIVVCDEPGEKIEVVCSPFEPNGPDYAGELLLAIFYRGREESFAVLTAAQAAQLAELLTERADQ